MAVGFGVRTGAQAEALGRVADAVVVGSALVAAIETAQAEGKDREAAAEAVLDVVRDLSAGVRRARLAFA